MNEGYLIPGSARDSRAVSGDSPDTVFLSSPKLGARRVAERGTRVACAPKSPHHASIHEILR